MVMLDLEAGLRLRTYDPKLLATCPFRDVMPGRPATVAAKIKVTSYQG